MSLTHAFIKAFKNKFTVIATDRLFLEIVLSHFTEVVLFFVIISPDVETSSTIPSAVSGLGVYVLSVRAVSPVD